MINKNSLRKFKSLNPKMKIQKTQKKQKPYRRSLINKQAKQINKNKLSKKQNKKDFKSETKNFNNYLENFKEQKKKFKNLKIKFQNLKYKNLSIKISWFQSSKIWRGLTQRKRISTIPKINQTFN